GKSCSTFDLVAIGFDHVGILHGHCFSKLWRNWRNHLLLFHGHTWFSFPFPGLRLAKHSRQLFLFFFFFSVLIDFFYKHIGTAKSLLKNRPSTPKQFRLGRGRGSITKRPRLCQKADI
ncbi:hypothetical protein COCCADRAFT_107923, partial [Bipolaris zeicola 26-R-13]